VYLLSIPEEYHVDDPGEGLMVNFPEYLGRYSTDINAKDFPKQKE